MTPAGIPEEDWTLVRRICRRHGVDPLLIVAIGMAETHWFTKGDGLKGNGLGVGSYDSGSTYKYSGVRGQVRRACEILAMRRAATNSGGTHVCAHAHTLTQAHTDAHAHAH